MPHHLFVVRASELPKAMTSLIFDNVGDTAPETIESKIKEAGGKIEVEMRKLDKGGFVVGVDSEKAAATMSKIADWCATKKIRCHLPKPVLQGTVCIIVKNLPTDYDPDEIVEALLEEGVTVLELYMFKNSRGMHTGTVKATAKGSNKVKEWLASGRGEIKGARIGVERQRTPTTCFNCNMIGHRSMDCKVPKKCKKCGQAGHLKADCKVGAEELQSKCNYCFEEGHRRGGCPKKRIDERDERQKFKMEKKDPVLENPWAKKPTSSKTSENNGSLEKMKEELKKELKEEMQLLQQDMMKEMMKDMMNQMKETMMEMMKKQMNQMMSQMLNQQQQWQKQQQQQWQQKQQQQHELSALKRKLATPKQQQGNNKKNIEHEQGGGTNLEKQFGETGSDEEENTHRIKEGGAWIEE